MSGLLVINHSDSRCAECGKGCSPHGERHDAILGYVDRGKPGCGAVWDRVTTDYIGGEMAEAARRLRPDLEWVEPSMDNYAHTYLDKGRAS